MSEDQPLAHMSTEESRQLAVIMFTDMVGYSKKMSTDEAHALVLLKEHDSVLQGEVDAHNGRTIKTIGDAFLVQYNSVHDAVNAAVKILQKLSERNEGKDDKNLIEVRIGIHAGEIILRGGDVFGDGVNIASRLESSAGRRQIFISDRIREMADGKLSMPLKNMGPRKLKNIKNPVIVHEVLWGDPLRIDRLQLTPSVAAAFTVGAMFFWHFFNLYL